jgi:hypothetical protein
MTVTQAQVDEVLSKLHDLLEQFALVRRRIDELREGEEMARRDYDQYMEAVNREADDLESCRDNLRLLLKGEEPISPLLPPGPGGDGGGGGDPIIDPIVPLPPPVQDKRAANKRALADHILYFMDSAAIDQKQIINRILVDDTQDVGQMLEALAWGPIWCARPEWETLEDQLARLEGWHDVLRERLSVWEREVHRVETSSAGALYRQLVSGTREEWLQYLESLVANQQAANAEIAGELVVLEGEWSKKQAQRPS